MSVYSDIIWWKSQNESACRDKAKRVAENFHPGRWSRLGPGDEEKGTQA